MFTPLLDRIIIKQLEATDTTKGGIIIPDSAQDKPLKGRVLAVGDKAKAVKVGDVVLFGQYAHQSFTYDREPFMVINEPDVIAVVPE